MINAAKIKELLQQPLPGKFSHQKMLPTGRKLSADVNDLKGAKHSGVMMLLFYIDNNLHVLLIKRPSHMKHHAGQVAMPGGRVEPGETSLESALRETWEEIGIKADAIKILGVLSDLYVEVSRFLIHPHVGLIENADTVQINKQEVEKLIAFPFNKIKQGIDESEIETITGKLKVPCYKYDNEIIWGATSMILTEFFDVIQQAIDQ